MVVGVFLFCFCRYTSLPQGRDAECTYSSETDTVKMDKPCYQDAWGTFAKENPLWRTRNGQTLLWWSEEAIQRHPQSLPQGSTFQQSRRNKLHRTEQSGEALSEEVLVNVRQKESAKPSRNVHSAKPELRHHQQSCLALTFVVPSATDSLFVWVCSIFATWVLKTSLSQASLTRELILLDNGSRKE